MHWFLPLQNALWFRHIIATKLTEIQTVESDLSQFYLIGVQQHWRIFFFTRPLVEVINDIEYRKLFPWFKLGLKICYCTWFMRSQMLITLYRNHFFATCPYTVAIRYKAHFNNATTKVSICLTISFCFNFR